jgi:hypothetical protein
MTEKEIKLLGFTRQDVTNDEHWESYHYYTYRITKGLEFISCASDGAIDGEWYIEVFNTEEPIRFSSFEEVQTLINKLEKAKHEKEQTGQ